MKITTTFLINIFVILNITMTNAKSIQMQTTYNTNANNNNDHSANTTGNQNIEGLPLASASTLTKLPNIMDKLDNRSSAAVDQQKLNELKITSTSMHTIVNNNDHHHAVERKRRSRLIRDINSDHRAVSSSKLSVSNNNDVNDDLDTAATYYFRPLFVYREQEAHRNKNPNVDHSKSDENQSNS